MIGDCIDPAGKFAANTAMTWVTDRTIKLYTEFRKFKLRYDSTNGVYPFAPNIGSTICGMPITVALDTQFAYSEPLASVMSFSAAHMQFDIRALPYGTTF